MTLILLCNYAPDRQQSMLRFGAMLREGFSMRGRAVEVIAPEPSVAGAALRRIGGRRAEKWIGYLDKYVLFPRRLRQRLGSVATTERGGTLVHVVDHSNAVYVPRRAEIPWVATCHDLLAVRGALGEDTDCPASMLGRRLQGAIVRGLARAQAIACDSTSTRLDLDRLVEKNNPSQARRVILLGLNHPYRRIEPAEALSRLAAVPDVPWREPFVLHVGSNLTRKNKAGVIRVFARLAAEWRGNLVLGGAPLTDELRAQAQAAGVAERVFAAPALDNAQLEAAYGAAHALLYPSRCEGFGWPVIEAQACGCPVVCSDRTSLPEIGGDAALVHALDDEAGMAISLRRLGEAPFRAAVVTRGFANLGRFGNDHMLDAYEELYAAARATWAQSGPPEYRS